ncbi:MAG: hypothetical protein QXI36_06140 [Candidatus Bathyarchaeia archaeon]
MSTKLKTPVLQLLREDEEFRYAVSGLIGLEDLRSSTKSLMDAVDRLTEHVDKLAEAQKLTEDRLNILTERVDRLAERVDKLAEAQKLTEDRLNILTERVDRLAEAQLRTEDHLKRLEIAVSNLAREVGRLSDVVGFGLEDVAKVVVPGWLYRHESIEVELDRRFMYIDGELVEVNLYGDGRRDGEEVIVVGECKSRIYDREVREFAEKLEKLVKAFQGRSMYTFMFGFLVHPSADGEARKRGITLIASYMR